MASAYVLQTMITSTATDTRKKVTFSCWFKRGTLGAYMQLLCNSPNPGSWDCVRINNADKLYLSLNNDSYYLTTNRVFRDVGAWYHVVARVDTTADSADRLQLWVNGVRETSFLTENQPTADYECNWGVNTQTNRLGMETWGTSQGWNGEMSHVHFCDGFAYDASDFGSFDSTSGIWKIKTSPSVSYGTNGWFLKMEDRTNLDLDSSGNAWSLSTVGTVTATYDNPSDNFATLNPLHESDPSGNYVLSNGNNTLTVTSNDYQRQVGVTILPAGLKGYFEWKAVTDSNYQQGFQVTSIKLGKTNYDTAATGDIYFLTGDPMRISYSNGGSAATWIASYFPTWAEGDIMGCAFDFTGTNRNVWFHRNGTYGNNGSGVGDPAAGTYPAMTSTQLPVTKEFEITHAANSGTTSVTSFKLR